jgi:hypothetical protein
MSKDEVVALMNVVADTDNKPSARSRNHYGHKYTLLKMENHRQGATIEKLYKQLEDAQTNAYRIAMIVFAVGCMVGGMIALAIEKGVVK